MTTAIEPASTAISGKHKAAILLASVGESLRGEILKQLSDREAKSVRLAIAGLGKISACQTDAVVEEFWWAVTSRDGRQDSAQEADSLDLSQLVRDEHPQTIAVILAYLPANRAAALIERLAAPARSDVALRLAELDSVRPEALASIWSAIAGRIESACATRSAPHIGPRAVGEILNCANPRLGEEILASIHDRRALVDAIRRCMFTFDHLAQIDANAIHELAAKIDPQVLAIALKGASAGVRNHFLGYMPLDGAERLHRDLQALGPVRIRDVEAAQQRVLAALQELNAEGGLLNHSERTQHGG